MNVNYKRFSCPICFLLPEREIYQCNNGHILCDKCIANLHECPQCRVSLQGIGKGIRNRALEEILDDLMIDCPFSDDGCRKKVGRSELSYHRSACSFGKVVPICKLLYFTECNFLLTVVNLNKVAQHIETKHDRPPFTACNEGRVSIELPNVFAPDVVTDSGIWARIIQFEKPRGKILFVTLIQDGYLSWIFLDFSADKKKGGRTYAEVSSDETPAISWKVPVYHVMEAEERIDNPSIKTNMRSLVEQRTEGTSATSSKSINYVVNIKITDAD